MAEDQHAVVEPPYSPNHGFEEDPAIELPTVVVDGWNGRNWGNNANFTHVEWAAQNWKPWAEEHEADIPQDAKNASGGICCMLSPTDRDMVFAWIADAKTDADTQLLENYRYYCHGHALGTFNTNTHAGYTVVMNYMHIVLNDPALFQRVVWEQPGGELNIPAGVEIRAGDIVAWWELDPSDPQAINCKHTAIIVTPRVEGGKLAGATTLSTKNGMYHAAPTRFDTLQREYKEKAVLGVYRPGKTAPADRMPTAEFKELLQSMLQPHQPQQQQQQPPAGGGTGTKRGADSALTTSDKLGRGDKTAKS